MREREIISTYVDNDDIRICFRSGRDVHVTVRDIVDFIAVFLMNADVEVTNEGGGVQVNAGNNPTVFNSNVFSATTTRRSATIATDVQANAPAPRINIGANLPYDYEAECFVLKKDNSDFGSILTSNVWEYLMSNLLLLTKFIETKKMSPGYANMRLSSVSCSNAVADTPFTMDVFSSIERTRNIRLNLGDEEGRSVQLSVVAPHDQRVFNSATTSQAARLDSVEAVMRDNIEPLRRSIVKQVSLRLDRMKKENEKNKLDLIKEGIAAAARMVPYGWEVTTSNGASYLYNPKKIYAESIGDGDTIYKLPDELKREFWVTNVYIPLNAKITDARAEGFHPHRSPPSTNEDEASCRRSTMLCIGDLKDKPISDVWKFTQAFVVINRQSMFGGKSSAFIQTLFNGRKVDTNGMNEWLKRKARMFNKYAGKLRPETVARQADGERNNIGQVFSV